jgi:hypothetical protein
MRKSVKRFDTLPPVQNQSRQLIETAWFIVDEQARTEALRGDARKAGRAETLAV